MSLDVSRWGEMGADDQSPSILHAEYHHKDHLGNVRVAFADRNGDGHIEILDSGNGGNSEVNQVLDYYPFGLQHPGLNCQPAAEPTNAYRFNGKEYNEDIGLYAYGFRYYDPTIGRFTGVDPISDQFPHVSTYNYAENEPVGHIDLHGLQKAKPVIGAKNLVVVIQGFDGKNDAYGKTQVTNDPNKSVDYGGLGDITTAFEGTTNQVVTFGSGRRGNTRDDVAATVNGFASAKPDGKIILVGHSMGGVNAINATKRIDDQAVDLAVILDLADLYDSDNVGSGARNVVNIFQTNDFILGGEDVEAIDPTKTNVQNFKALNSTHTSIDNDFRGMIIQMIENLTGVKSNIQTETRNDVEKQE